jgi:hypothetical protein
LSPYFTDNVQGIRYDVAAGIQDDLIAGPPHQALTAQDTVAVQVTGGGAESDGALLSAYYDDLPGANPVMKMGGDIMGSTDYVATWAVAAVGGAIGAWGGVAITNPPVLGVAVQGADTSNFNIGAPGVTQPYRTKSYFLDLSESLGKPCIPLINSANKGNTVVNVVDIAAATAVHVTLIVAILNATYSPS